MVSTPPLLSPPLYSSTTHNHVRGEHIHHGYWPTDDSKSTESKETAQLNLIRLLLEISSLSPSPSQPLRVLDVGCGIGGTSRYLASELECSVTGITISTKQVEIAKRLSSSSSEIVGEYIPHGKGELRFVELDAEKMGEFFKNEKKFDAVWISEALSHFPDKGLFFRNAQKVLKSSGKLVLADWFKDDGLGEKEFDADIKPIEGKSRGGCCGKAMG